MQLTPGVIAPASLQEPAVKRSYPLEDDPIAPNPAVDGVVAKKPRLPDATASNGSKGLPAARKGAIAFDPAVQPPHAAGAQKPPIAAVAAATASAVPADVNDGIASPGAETPAGPVSIAGMKRPPPGRDDHAPNEEGVGGSGESAKQRRGELPSPGAGQNGRCRWIRCQMAMVLHKQWCHDCGAVPATPPIHSAIRWYAASSTVPATALFPPTHQQLVRRQERLSRNDHRIPQRLLAFWASIGTHRTRAGFMAELTNTLVLPLTTPWYCH